MAKLITNTDFNDDKVDCETLWKILEEYIEQPEGDSLGLIKNGVKIIL